MSLSYIYDNCAEKPTSWDVLSLGAKAESAFFLINCFCHWCRKINGYQCIISFTSGKILNWRQGMLNSMLNYEAFLGNPRLVVPDQEQLV